MAFTYRNKRSGYDNIAVGSATGLENAVVAGTGRGETTRPNLDSGGNTSTSTLAIGRRENSVRQPSTDDNTVQETKDTSNTSHTGDTSNSSNTSVLRENVG